MDDISDPPPPVRVVSELTAIEPGQSQWFGANYRTDSIRVALTRLKRAGKGTFTTRPEDGGLRVWRLS